MFINYSLGSIRLGDATKSAKRIVNFQGLFVIHFPHELHATVD
jgi:hypothetical protein